MKLQQLTSNIYNQKRARTLEFYHLHPPKTRQTAHPRTPTETVALAPLPVYTLTCICSVEYTKRVEPVFEIIAEPNHFRRWMPGWLRSVGSGPLT